MLFEFHQKQNAKKPKSVHATYLITGTKRAVEHANGTNGRGGEDVSMRSSPFMSSMPEPEEPADEPIKRTHVVLVREEELESAYDRGKQWFTFQGADFHDRNSRGIPNGGINSYIQP
jgi:hypothetical protein